MNQGGSKGPTRDSGKSVRKRVLQVGSLLLLFAAVLFLASGRLDWVMAWVYLALYLAVVVVTFLVLLPRHPGLITERAEIRADAKGWDKVLATLAGSFGPLIVLLVSGLDQRFRWSPPLELATQLIALLIVVLGFAVFAWAMAANPFFSAVVRIQKERGHKVASGGPYRYVRHPGYFGLLLYPLATPFLLGSIWALFPAAVTACLIVVRTALEDLTLRAELEGYKDYARAVPYRLLPRVW